MQKSDIVNLAINRVSLADYFNKYVVGLKTGVTAVTDGTSATLCPFHDEHDPSFHIYNYKGITRYKCFGCGVSGTVVDLFILTQRMYHNIIYKTYDEGAIALLHLYGIDVASENVVVESPFDIAMKKVQSYGVLDIKPDFNFARFRTINNTIKNGNYTSNQSRARAYEEIDRMATAYLMMDDDKQ